MLDTELYKSIQSLANKSLNNFPWFDAAVNGTTHPPEGSAKIRRHLDVKSWGG